MIVSPALIVFISIFVGAGATGCSIVATCFPSRITVATNETGIQHPFI